MNIFLLYSYSIGRKEKYMRGKKQIKCQFCGEKGYPLYTTEGEQLCSLCGKTKKKSKAPTNTLTYQRTINNIDTTQTFEPPTSLQPANYQRMRYLAQRYNMKWEDYTALLDHQKNACAICGKPFNKTPRIDHDRTAGKVRGLLCNKCNNLLMAFEDTPFTTKAKSYLAHPPITIIEEQRNAHS